MKSILIYMLTLMVISCGKTTYEIREPRPVLELSLLQNTYVIDEPIYLQLSVSQKGYEGEFQVSVILNEGACDIVMNGTEISTTGEWTKLSNPTEILTLTPRQAGPLRLSFEVKTNESQSSDRSIISLKVVPSAALQFSVEYPKTESLKKSVEITVTITKSGYAGAISTKYEQLSNMGTLQYGAVTVVSGEAFSIPANSTQKLYYTATARGIHKIQLTATDGYTTEFRILEFIITE